MLVKLMFFKFHRIVTRAMKIKSINFYIHYNSSINVQEIRKTLFFFKFAKFMKEASVSKDNNEEF